MPQETSKLRGGTSRILCPSDINTRKILFRNAVLDSATLLQQMESTLRKKSDGRMPMEFFRDLLQERLSDDEVRQQIETALNWGRYAEIFTYDAEKDQLMLNEPTGAETRDGRPALL